MNRRSKSAGRTSGKLTMMLTILPISLVVAANLSTASAQAAASCQDPKALEARLKSAPGDVKLLRSLGEAYLCLGRPADAQLNLEDSLALDYKNFDGHFLLGRALFEQGKFEAALFEYTQLQALFPERFEAPYNRGVTLARLSRTDEAITAFTAALDLAKKSNAPAGNLVDTLVGLAGQQRVKGDLAGAAKSYGDALAVRPTDQGIALLQARTLFDGGQGPQALPIAFDLTSKNPANTRAAVLIADIFEAQGLPERAVRELDRAIGAVKDKNERVTLYVRRGLVQSKAGAKSEAVESFREAVRSNPESWEAQYNLAAARLASSPAEALSGFRAAARIKPEDGETQLGIATALEATRDYAEAAGAASRAVQLLTDPALKTRATVAAGRSNYLAGKNADAVASLKGADAGNAEAQLWLGLAYLALKDYQNASVALENAVKADPSSLAARTNLGAAYYAAKRYGEAETVLRPVVTADPRNAEALTNLGLALANLNRTEEARAALSKAADLGSNTARQALRALEGK
jgi:tetratricopeptide (TPR) repeat protein